MSASPFKNLELLTDSAAANNLRVLGLELVRHVEEARRRLSGQGQSGAFPIHGFLEEAKDVRNALFDLAEEVETARKVAAMRAEFKKQVGV